MRCRSADSLRIELQAPVKLPAARALNTLPVEVIDQFGDGAALDVCSLREFLGGLTAQGAAADRVALCLPCNPRCINHVSLARPGPAAHALDVAGVLGDTVSRIHLLGTERR